MFHDVARAIFRNHRDSLDGSFHFPDVPISLVFVTEVASACNDVFLVFTFPFGTGDLLFDVPIFVGFRFGGAVSIRIII